MKYLFWTSGLLLIPLIGSSTFFFSLYLGTGGHSAQGEGRGAVPLVGGAGAGHLQHLDLHAGVSGIAALMR